MFHIPLSCDILGDLRNEYMYICMYRISNLHPLSSTVIFNCQIKIFHFSSGVKLDSLLIAHTIMGYKTKTLYL